MVKIEHCSLRGKTIGLQPLVSGSIPDSVNEGVSLIGKMSIPNGIYKFESCTPSKIKTNGNNSSIGKRQIANLKMRVRVLLIPLFYKKHKRKIVAYFLLTFVANKTNEKSLQQRYISWL